MNGISRIISLPRLVPLAALAFFGAIHFFSPDSHGSGPGLLVSLLILPVLLATVLAAVYHAEKIAHTIGEPYGTLVLTMSVTIIEVSLIMSVMLADHGEATMARDTVFSVIMIVCNLLVGLCILAGGLRYHQQDFEVEGASAYLAVLTALSVLTLVLPNYTQVAGPTLTNLQLEFEAVVTILLYAVFLYIQTVRHTEHFTEVGAGPLTAEDRKPAPRMATVFLLISLAAVILLAETFAEAVKSGLSYVGWPAALAGFIVALLILLPEGITALRASRNNELQRSLNLALGSSLATIGLTVPAVAIISVFLGTDLVLGLSPMSTVLLALTILISTLTFGRGRTNILYGFVHLIIFATYIFLIFEP